MRAVGVIPARLQSQRFPEKILAPIFEKPMIVCVAEKASQAKKLNEVIIAVDDAKTVEVLKPYDLNVVMTSKDHTSGSDRIAEAVKDIEADIVVNIQGDEPMITPEIIDDMINEFDDLNVQMVTAVSTVLSEKDINDPNSVKARLDDGCNAVMFVRKIPDGKISDWYHHVGIYAYRKETLFKFKSLPPTENEKKHNLEQLRALDNGIKIKAVVTDFPFRGVDTEKDLTSLLQYLTTERKK